MRAAVATWAASTESGPRIGKSFEHHAKLGIRFDQLGDRIHRLLAVAAVVVEEFDERDVAARIAHDGLVGRVHDFVAVLADGLFARGGLGDLFALSKFVNCFLDHFRIGNEIVVHDLLDLHLLLARKFLGEERRRRA